MSTLGRYVASRFLIAFAGSLLILTLVVLVVDMLLNLGDILEFAGTFSGMVRYLLLRFVSVYLPYLFPVATFTGAFVSVGQAARNNEIIAMKAGGISPRIALLPVFIGAAVLSIAALLVQETLTVRAHATLIEDTEEGSDRSSSVQLRSGSLWYNTGRTIYNVGSTDAAGSSVRDFRMLERDDQGRLVRLVRAERAVRIAPHEWELEAATVRHFDPASASSPPRTEQASRMTLRVEDDRSPTTLQAEVDALPIWTLAEYVSKRGTPRDRAMFQQRLTGPLLVLLFALLAVPLALRVERTKSLAAPAVQGVGILFVFLLAREYAAAFASSDVSAVALPWLVILVFAGFGLVQLARTPN